MCSRPGSDPARSADGAGGREHGPGGHQVSRPAPQNAPAALDAALKNHVPGDSTRGGRQTPATKATGV